jgi:PGF-CTERM protein
MVGRRSIALLLPVLLLASALPLPEAGAQGGEQPRCDLGPVRHLSCIEALHLDEGIRGITHNLYSIAWRPVPNPLNGLHEALIVGGIPGEFTVGLPVRSLVLLYDGVKVNKIYDKEGPQFVDVAWAPDGSYALVVSNRKALLRVDPPQPGSPAYKFSNLWDDCSKVQVVNCNEAPFFGHQVAFNPVQGYAWITGSSLLQYDGQELSVVDPGADIAWRAIGWNPAGTVALLSALVCVDPNNTGQDVPCVGNVTQNKVVPGRIVHADVAASKLCEVTTYGRFDVQKAEVNGITWSPDGTYAFVYGDDDFHGTILKFDATKPSTGTTGGGCPILRDSFTWLPLVKEEGEFNDMAFHRKTQRYWAAAGAGKELWEGNATTFKDVLGEHDITRGKGTIYYSVSWDPQDDYLLVGGFAGRLYKFVPATHPFNRITTPKNNTWVTGDVLLAGKAFSPTLFEPVERLEVNITGAHGSTGWMPANITGQFRSMSNWSLTWKTDALPPGFYVVSSRAWIGDKASNPSNRTVQVVRSGGLSAPQFVDPPAVSPTGNFTLRWTTTGGQGAIYELEEAGIPTQFGAGGEGAVSLTQDFAFAGDERLLYNGTVPSFAVEERKDGQYFYRIRVRSADGVSTWSPAIGIAVAIDSDGDGFPDAAEVARGSSPTDGTSNPDNLDGDDCLNRDDAFPYDPNECLDTDGDGVGDKSDKYPLDPREFADSDNDGWGDASERRLGANPFDPASTPESDDDQDGCLNKDEAEAQTNPKDPGSAPAWCRIGGAPNQVQGGSKGAPGFEALGALAALGAAVLVRRRR